MKDFFIKLNKELTLEKIVVRLCMAWLLTAICFFLKNPNEAFNNVLFTSKINFAMYMCFLLLFFAFFTAVGMVKRLVWVETFGPLILVTIYGTLTLNKHQEISYLIGVMAGVILAIIYANSKRKTFLDIERKRYVIAIYVIAAAGYMGIAITTTVLRYLTYSAPAFDFGIWTQMFANMKSGFLPVTTVERSRELSHFAVHFSPAYYIFLPFYMIAPSPITLQVLQVLTLASGLVPIYLLCKKSGLSKAATAAFGLLFAFFPALTTGCFYDLHENCFLVPFILWLFYFIEAEKLPGMIVFAILTMLVKEDAPVYVACIGLYIILGKNRKNRGVILLVMGVVYFVAVTMLLKKYGEGIMSNRYENFMLNQGGGLVDVVRTLISNPGYFFDQCFDSANYEFLVLMLMPLGLLSLATKKLSRFVLLIPMLLINLASEYSYQHSIFFQYVFGSMAILFYLAIVNYADLSERVRRFLCAVALCTTIVVMPMTSLTKKYYISTYKANRDCYETITAALDSIPEDASVAATSFFIPHLSEHEKLYEYPGWYEMEMEPEYIAIDLRYAQKARTQMAEVEEMGYSKIDYAEGLYAIYKK